MEKKAYIKPELTICTFRSERGYADSAKSFGTPFLIYLDSWLLNNGGNNYQEMETFSEHDSWNQSDGNAFWD